MKKTRYEVLILKGNEWVSQGERPNPLQQRRLANLWKKAGFKTKRMRVIREEMTDEEIK